MTHHVFKRKRADFLKIWYFRGMHLLVTGGAGFIGSHYIEYLLQNEQDTVITNVDSLTYAAHPETQKRLEKLGGNRYRFYRADICSSDIKKIVQEREVKAVVNFAAESHVDRSILDPMAFVKTNVEGVQNLLSVARNCGNLRFVQVSTDEVYGTLSPTSAQSTEKSPLEPNSPYAASKAAADLLVLANVKTYGQQAVITRCTNNYGPYQFPEKLIPLLIANALEDIPVPVYGDGKQVRDWIFVEDHCSGINTVIKKGKPGEVYNISANEERPNIAVVKKVLSLLGKPESLIQYVGDRPAHDRRYGLNARKISEELGWKPSVSFDKGLELTVKWYLKNQDWWKKVRGKDYYSYYQANYASKQEVGL